MRQSFEDQESGPPSNDSRFERRVLEPKKKENEEKHKELK